MSESQDVIVNRDNATGVRRCEVRISTRLMYSTPTGLICYTVRCPNARRLVLTSARQSARSTTRGLSEILDVCISMFLSQICPRAHVSRRTFFFFTCFGDSQLSSGFSGGDRTKRWSEVMLARLTSQISMKNAHRYGYTFYPAPSIGHHTQHGQPFWIFRLLTHSGWAELCFWAEHQVRWVVSAGLEVKPRFLAPTHTHKG